MSGIHARDQLKLEPSRTKASLDVALDVQSGLRIQDSNRTDHRQAECRVGSLLSNIDALHLGVIKIVDRSTYAASLSISSDLSIFSSGFSHATVGCAQFRTLPLQRRGLRSLACL